MDQASYRAPVVFLRSPPRGVCGGARLLDSLPRGRGCVYAGVLAPAEPTTACYLQHPSAGKHRLPRSLLPSLPSPRGALEGLVKLCIDCTEANKKHPKKNHNTAASSHPLWIPAPPILGARHTDAPVSSRDLPLMSPPPRLGRVTNPGSSFLSLTD